MNECRGQRGDWGKVGDRSSHKHAVVDDTVVLDVRDPRDSRRGRRAGNRRHHDAVFIAIDVAQSERAAFLSEQLGRFDGSYVLTFAGYNAGPRRAQQWVQKYGDPRGKDLDEVVDWIERIPYTETRSYVQRVMAALR